jgi:hypothetical protein
MKPSTSSDVPPNASSGLRYRCFREVERCAEERLPVTLRVMRAVE